MLVWLYDWLIDWLIVKTLKNNYYMKTCLQQQAFSRLQTHLTYITDWQPSFAMLAYDRISPLTRTDISQPTDTTRKVMDRGWKKASVCFPQQVTLIHSCSTCSFFWCLWRNLWTDISLLTFANGAKTYSTVVTVNMILIGESMDRDQFPFPTEWSKSCIHQYRQINIVFLWDITSHTLFVWVMFDIYIF